MFYALGVYGLSVSDQFKQLTGLCGSTNREWNFVNFPHDFLVGLVDGDEHLRLSGKLSLNVGGAEDTLQIQPVSLTNRPLIL